MKDRILSIQYMRGIAALLVVLFHYRFMLNNRYAQEDLGGIFSYGGLGVDIFFMISGFIISFSTKNDYSKRNFIIKRAFRILPVYWMVLFIILIFADNVKLDINFLKSMFLIQWDYSSSAPFFGYSTLITAWTLSFEVTFYILFMLSMAISHKYRSIICSVLIISTVMILQLYFNRSFNISGYSSASTDYSILRLLSSPMLLEFAFGMLVYEFTRLDFKIYKNKHVKYFINIIFLTSLFYTLACYLSGHGKGHGLQGYGGYTAFLFFFWVLHEKVNTIKDVKALRNLGDWSYSIYLIHFMLLMLIPFIDHYLTIFLVSYGASKFIFLTCMTIVISKVTYDYLEKKSMIISKYFLK
ncbi:TPA: acyltransferase [Escherichia coli]|nr:acyltransferase [Escherichia coli]